MSDVRRCRGTFGQFSKPAEIGILSDPAQRRASGVGVEDPFIGVCPLISDFGD